MSRRTTRPTAARATSTELWAAPGRMCRHRRYERGVAERSLCTGKDQHVIRASQSMHLHSLWVSHRLRSVSQRLLELEVRLHRRPLVLLRHHLGEVGRDRTRSARRRRHPYLSLAGSSHRRCVVPDRRGAAAARGAEAGLRRDPADAVLSGAPGAGGAAGGLASAEALLRGGVGVALSRAVPLQTVCQEVSKRSVRGSLGRSVTGLG